MWRRLALVLVGAWVGAALGGCIVYRAAKTTGELAATTVIVAGRTATAAVKTTGRVTTAALTSGGELTATGIESLAALAQAGMVTFFDAESGAVVRVPWRSGLTLHAAGLAADVAVAQRGIALVRRGQVVRSAARAGASLLLESGDVIRLAARVVR